MNIFEKAISESKSFKKRIERDYPDGLWEFRIVNGKLKLHRKKPFIKKTVKSHIFINDGK